MEVVDMNEMELFHTLDEALHAVGFGKFQFLVLAYAGLGAMAEVMEVCLLGLICGASLLIIMEEGNIGQLPKTEFLYVEQGILATGGADGSSSTRKPFPGQERKWWLPVPLVSPGGLTEYVRKTLQHKRDWTNQILKATMAINSVALAEMDIPDSYLEALPKVVISV